MGMMTKTPQPFATTEGKWCLDALMHALWPHEHEQKSTREDVMAVDRP
jgi:hypothetical protein